MLVTMTSWRLLTHGAGSPACNMAVDEALLRNVREPVLRIYEWSVPAVSLGYFQPSALAGERPFVRRYTGGGLVDHAHDVTYTIVLPRAHPWLQLSAPEDYQGCELQIHASAQIDTAPKTRGTLIAFPSYTLHRVTPITAGLRRSLVMWCSGPRFR